MRAISCTDILAAIFPAMTSGGWTGLSGLSAGNTRASATPVGPHMTPQQAGQRLRTPNADNGPAYRRDSFSCLTSTQCLSSQVSCACWTIFSIPKSKQTSRTYRHAHKLCQAYRENASMQNKEAQYNFVRITSNHSLREKQ